MAILGLMAFVDDLFLFLVGVWLFAYLPGRWWVRKLTFSPLDSFLTSLVLGLVQFTLLQFFLGFIGLRWQAYLLTALLGLWSLKKQGLKLARPSRGWEIARPTWLVLAIGVIGQSSLVFRSGLSLADGSVLFTEYRDALWHLALIEELAVQVPPFHPGFAGMRLTHYHFLTDLFFGSLLAVLPLDRLDLLFRVIPLFLSGLFGLVLVSLARNLIKGGESLLLLLTYFSGSLAWVLPLVFPGMPWGDSSFWVSQTFAMLLNPPLSLSLSLVGFLSILLFFLQRDWGWPLELAVALLAGSIIGFKVYGGIVTTTALLGFGLAQLLAREKRVLRLGLLTSLVALAVFLPTNDLKGSTGFLIWAPGWFLRAMVEHADRVYRPGMVLAEEFLRAQGSVLGVIRLRMMELATFLVGNLGVRTLGLVGVYQALKRWGSSVFSFWILILLSGVVFPLLFIQRGSVANTIQTFYYALLAADLLTVTLLVGFDQKSRRWVHRLVVLMILAAAVPTNLKLIRESVQMEPLRVSAQEMAGYRLLAALPRKETLILVPPTPRHLDAIWVGALADKRVVYSDRLMAENTHQPFEQRMAEVERFFRDQDPVYRRDFLKRLRVTHLVLVGPEAEGFSPQDLPVDKIVDNEGILIYKVRDL